MLEICSPGWGAGDSSLAQREACLSHVLVHTHTPSVVHTLTGTCPQIPAIFTGGWHPPTSAHKHHTAHAHQHSGANTTPKPISKPTQRAGKERKVRKNPLAEIPSVPQPGGASQACLFPPSLSLSLSLFFSLFTASESSRPINLEGPTEAEHICMHR